MRRTRTRRLACIAATLAALATATAAAAKAPATPSSEGPCAHAAALYEAKLYGKAEQAYARLLGVDPCARPADVALVRRAAADTAADLIDEAEALRDAGFEAASREVVQQLVTAYPKTSVPGGLQSPTQRLADWQKVLATVGPLLLSAAELIAALLILVIAVRLLWLLGAAALRSSRHPKLLVPAFVGMDADDAGDGAKSALHEHLTQLQKPRAGRSLFFADGTEPAFAGLPDAIASSFPQAGLVAALATFLGQLGLRTQWRVAGTLRPVDAWRGAGLTIVLSKQHGSEAGQVTIWERDYHLIPEGDQDEDTLPGRYQRLALPAAVWLAYRPELDFDTDHPPVGTLDWRSYARFAVGEDAQESGDDALADRLYRDALDLDPGNLGARTNLAALLLSPPPSQSPAKEPEPPAAYGERMALLNELLAYVAVRLGDDTDDPLWYRVHYLTAIARLYEGSRREDRTLLRSAAAEAGRIAVAIATPPHPESLQPLLDRMRLPVTVLRANIQVELEGLDADEVELTVPWIGAAADYNLACHFARRLRKLHALPDAEQQRDEQTELTERALSHLRSALAYGDAETRMCAGTDPALEPLYDNEEFKRLVAEPAAPATASANGAVRATVMQGTLISLSSGDGADGAVDGK